MGSKAPDVHRLTLMVLRLMDADILSLAEGNALLAEIQALVLTPDQPAEEEADRRDPPTIAPSGDGLSGSGEIITG